MSTIWHQLPRLLIGTRVVLLLPLWVLALNGMQRALAIGLLIAVTTDILDGMAARRLGQDGDERLAHLDSLADKLLTLSVLAWLMLLHPNLIRDHAPLALTALLLALSSWLVGLIKHGRVTGLHLRLAQVAGLVQALFVLHTFWQGSYSPLFFNLAAGLWCLAAAEEIAVQLIRRRIDGSIRSLLPLKKE